MDLEHLNKSQIILLTLLVSFVTSVATGIVTVTLLEEAPPVIAQTVNRVVERTVERVVSSGQTAGATTVTEKTVVVKESDLIAQAVDRVKPSIVRLYASKAGGDGTEEFVFLGLGFVLKDDGTIVTDSAALPSGSSLSVMLSDGARVPASIVSSDTGTGLAVLQGATSTEDGALTWQPASLASLSPTLGKVVVGVSGREAMRIGDGIVTALSVEEGEEPGRIVETDVPAGAIAYGSPLINVDGTIEGISTHVSRVASENSFLASPAIIMYTSPIETPEGDQAQTEE